MKLEPHKRTLERKNGATIQMGHSKHGIQHIDKSEMDLRPKQHIYLHNTP